MTRTKRRKAQTARDRRQRDSKRLIQRAKSVGLNNHRAAESMAGAMRHLLGAKAFAALADHIRERTTA